MASALLAFGASLGVVTSLALVLAPLLLVVLYYIGYSKVMKSVLGRQGGKLHPDGDGKSPYSKFDNGLIGLFLVLNMIVPLGIFGQARRTRALVGSSDSRASLAAVMQFLLSSIVALLVAVGAGIMSYVHFGNRYDKELKNSLWSTTEASLILPLAAIPVNLMFAYMQSKAVMAAGRKESTP